MPNHITNIVTFEGELSDIAKLMEFIKVEDETYGSFDFNKIVPMPESMGIECGTIQKDAMSVYFSAINPDTEDMGIPKVSKKEFKEKLGKVSLSKLYQPKDINTNMRYDDVLKISKDIFNNPRKNTEHMYDDDIFAIGKAVIDNLTTYGVADWYDWRRRNWGTKWNSYYHKKKSITDTEIEFMTANSAPHPVILQLSALFPFITITHKWADEDCGYNCGWSEYKNGDGEVHEINEYDFEFAAPILGYNLDLFVKTRCGHYLSVDDFPWIIDKEIWNEWLSKGLNAPDAKKVRIAGNNVDCSMLSIEHKKDVLKQLIDSGFDVYEFAIS